MTTSSSGDQKDISWNDVVRFIQQLSHDLRNHLNAAELQSAYIAELTSDSELKEEIKRLREIISTLAATLQGLTASLGSPKLELIAFPAADFIEDLRNKIGKNFPQDNVRITWDVQTEGSMLNIDPQTLPQAFVEIFRNAFQHEPDKGAIAATAKIDNGRLIFTFREPKQRFDLSTENWGREPLRRASRGHYGLGLNRARSIVEAHDGQFGADYDSRTSTLVTTITLPLAKT